MKKYLSIILVFSLVCCLLTGCGKPSDNGGTINNSKTSVTKPSDTSSDPVDVDFSKADADMFTERDCKTEYDESKAVSIQLNGTSATSSSNSVKISGSTVTITEEATYVISGTLTDGMIIINAEDTAKLQIVLNGVDITSKTSAALYILEADKVFVTLADGTENTLANGGTFTAIDENNIDAAIFSKQDLTFNGSGSLTVTSPEAHGIACKDDLVFTGGTYTVNSASHGLDANDSVRISSSTKLTIDAGKDGIHCENTDDASLGFIYISDGTMNIEAEGDGISAGAYVQIENGTFDLLIGGGSENGSKEHSDNFGGFMGGGHGGGRPGEMRPGSSQSSTITTDESGTSMKGIKAANSLLISGGTFKIDSADDSVHSDVSVTINGGTFEIASGDDAIHAEETLTVTAGTFNITESYEGLEALNIDVKGGEFKIVASDDGLNAAGGTDQSGTTGGRDGMFGGGGKPGGIGGHGGMSSNSNGSIKVSGGNLYVKASGDGIDANGTLEISGGYTIVVGPTQGDTATLDYDKSATITGGMFIGTGAQGMAQTFSESKQGVVAVSMGNQSAGTNITLKDKGGNTIIEYAPELSFAVVILSSPDIVSGETYTITVGSESGEFEAS
ncbi:MAG: carbohydrate-binding domain-containing protein [Ruminococcaceae bacterium]|nr:carbohydrate-binding domain-containing protein [Oscillospiraceae bacterium]